MLCVFKKILWYNTFDDYLKVIIFQSGAIAQFGDRPIKRDRLIRRGLSKHYVIYIFQQ